MTGVHVPAPERIPLPPNEPTPSTPWGPNPEYGDLPQRAGDLSIGTYAGLVWREKAVRRRKPKIPYGFQLDGSVKEER